MLRGSDRISRSELLKQVGEQKQQLALYEKKLKDIIRAFKSLNAEKEALQTTIEALGIADAVNGSEVGETNESKTSIAVSEDRLEELKRSLLVLITENKRRETALQADKKALLELRAKLIRIEEDRERELIDHGSVLAEMQQRFAREKSTNEQIKKQFAELYKKLHEKDALPMQMENSLKELQSDLDKAKDDVEFWKKKAEKIPTIQMLESELQNIKKGSELEIQELKLKLSNASDTEKESRLQKLEERLKEITSSLGNLERTRIKNEQIIKDLRKKNAMLKKENEILSQSSVQKEVESLDLETLKQKTLHLIEMIRNRNGGVNFYETIGVKESSNDSKYEELKEEFELYKLKAQSVLRSRNISLGEDGLPSVSSLPKVDECSSCASAEIELHNLRSAVASLHEKLYGIEIDHANAKNDYEEKCTELQKTIVELQASQIKTVNCLRQQMQQKISEMEAEMQKQRVRTLDILAEKEKELEIAKNQRVVSNDPIDPPQRELVRKKPSLEFSESSNAIEKPATVFNSCASLAAYGRAASETESYSSVMDEHPLERLSEKKYSLANMTNTVEAKNIFYEQQLAIKEKEIIDLSSAIRMAEMTIRDLQQSSITKDLQHFEIIGKLKDEIRILEGKLNFHTSDAHMEYLRNVFIQLLHCESYSKRKHILKAIGTVLKLSIVEMRLIDKHTV
ncbi:unnamed protein product [Dracunculus medinensis]|uniref:GRIP domain-containing protein n=1 Tax=Dracunculus medinensis TaxID=318479 RepID=A0A158Q602_DRAME|nr:unnamed protein product [Dracunculus medinensis]